METYCTGCGGACSHVYATWKGDPYHFFCIPMRKRATGSEKSLIAPAGQLAGSPEQNQAMDKLYEDEEAMKAVRYLASKYTAEEIIDQWWRMERGK